MSQVKQYERLCHTYNLKVELLKSQKDGYVHASSKKEHEHLLSPKSSLYLIISLQFSTSNFFFFPRLCRVEVLVVFLLPVLVISTMLCLIRRGLLALPRMPGAAPEGAIDALPAVAFEAHRFNDEPNGLSSSCAVCLEAFNGRQADRQEDICMTYVV